MGHETPKVSRLACICNMQNVVRFFLITIWTRYLDVNNLKKYKILGWCKILYCIYFTPNQNKCIEVYDQFKERDYYLMDLNI